MSDRRSEQEFIPAKTLIVTCRSIKPGVPLKWLDAGWADFRQTERISLIYALLVFCLNKTGPNKTGDPKAACL